MHMIACKVLYMPSSIPSQIFTWYDELYLIMLLCSCPVHACVSVSSYIIIIYVLCAWHCMVQVMYRELVHIYNNGCF